MLAGANGINTGSSVASLTNKATCGFQNNTFTYQSPRRVVEPSESDAVTPPIRSSTFFVPRTISASPVSRPRTRSMFTVSDHLANVVGSFAGRERTR